MSATILIAEDESLNRKNIAQVLEDEGYIVYQAENGTDAIDAVNKLDFDLVLSDYKMPGVDGLGILQHVRDVAPQTMFI
ncbi:MAG: response regulator, partial [Gammaproteobacteria bacterium]